MAGYSSRPKWGGGLAWPGAPVNITPPHGHPNIFIITFTFFILCELWTLLDHEWDIQSEYKATHLIGFLHQFHSATHLHHKENLFSIISYCWKNVSIKPDMLTYLLPRKRQGDGSKKGQNGGGFIRIDGWRTMVGGGWGRGTSSSLQVLIFKYNLFSPTVCWEVKSSHYANDVFSSCARKQSFG